MLFFFFRSYANFLFFFLMLMGVFLSVKGESIYSVWVGVEISFLGVMFLISGDSVEEVEGSMKYFIIQVVSSHVFLLSIFSVIGGWWSTESVFLMMVSMLLKLGVFPFHFWVPAVFSQLSYLSLVLVGVVQKVIPLWLLSSLSLSGSVLSIFQFILVVSSFVGAVGGLGTLHFRSLLSYSSISHTCFLAAMSVESFFSCMMYLMVYFFLSIGLNLSLWVMKVYSFSDLSKCSTFSKESATLMISFYGLSLAGMPPFSGFFPKVCFLLVCWEVCPVVCVVFLGFSIVSLYYYYFLFSSFSVYSKFGGVVFKLKEWSWGNLFSLSVVLNMVSGVFLFLILGAFW
uniref:NADH dehydrogenase subunit 2 n=1 Tax=Mactra alta TaxID=1131947 RepID=UPI00286C6E11|nr:NADH dehydrogenase subunit 2 [Mactra alta]WLS55680.1 NADH dehydrogenase subunit 2 [Mactra alta]